MGESSQFQGKQPLGCDRQGKRKVTHQARVQEREAGTDRQDRRTESARALCSDKEEAVGYSSETVSRLVLGQKALQLRLRS